MGVLFSGSSLAESVRGGKADVWSGEPGGADWLSSGAAAEIQADRDRICCSAVRPARGGDRSGPWAVVAYVSSGLSSGRDLSSQRATALRFRRAISGVDPRRSECRMKERSDFE